MSSDLNKNEDSMSPVSTQNVQNLKLKDFETAEGSDTSALMKLAELACNSGNSNRDDDGEENSINSDKSACSHTTVETADVNHKQVGNSVFTEHSSELVLTEHPSHINSDTITDIKQVDANSMFNNKNLMVGKNIDTSSKLMVSSEVDTCNQTTTNTTDPKSSIDHSEQQEPSFISTKEASSISTTSQASSVKEFPSINSLEEVLFINPSENEQATCPEKELLANISERVLSISVPEEEARLFRISEEAVSPRKKASASGAAKGATLPNICDEARSPRLSEEALSPSPRLSEEALSPSPRLSEEALSPRLSEKALLTLSPTHLEEGSSHNPLAGALLPSPSEKASSTSHYEEALLNSYCEKASSTSFLEEASSPHGSLPTFPDKATSPHSPEKTSSFHSTEDFSVPTSLKKASTPHSADEPSSPHPHEEASLPRPPEEVSSLSHSEEAPSNSYCREASSPHICEEASSPHLCEEASSSHLCEEVSLPHPPDETSSPHPPEETSSLQPPKKDSHHLPEKASSPHPHEETSSPHVPEKASSSYPHEEASSPHPPEEVSMSTSTEIASSLNPPEKSLSTHSPEEASSPRAPKVGSPCSLGVTSLPSPPDYASSPSPSVEASLPIACNEASSLSPHEESSVNSLENCPSSNPSETASLITPKEKELSIPLSKNSPSIKLPEKTLLTTLPKEIPEISSSEEPLLAHTLVERPLMKYTEEFPLVSPHEAVPLTSLSAEVLPLTCLPEKVPLISILEEDSLSKVSSINSPKNEQLINPHEEEPFKTIPSKVGPVINLHEGEPLVNFPEEVDANNLSQESQSIDLPVEGQSFSHSKEVQSKNSNYETLLIESKQASSMDSNEQNSSIDPFEQVQITCSLKNKKVTDGNTSIPASDKDILVSIKPIQSSELKANKENDPNHAAVWQGNGDNTESEIPIVSCKENEDNSDTKTTNQHCFNSYNKLDDLNKDLSNIEVCKIKDAKTSEVGEGMNKNDFRDFQDTEKSYGKTDSVQSFQYLPNLQDKNFSLNKDMEAVPNLKTKCIEREEKGIESDYDEDDRLIIDEDQTENTSNVKLKNNLTKTPEIVSSPIIGKPEDHQNKEETTKKRKIPFEDDADDTSKMSAKKKTSKDSASPDTLNSNKDKRESKQSLDNQKSSMKIEVIDLESEFEEHLEKQANNVQLSPSNQDICMKCKQIWNDDILNLLFEGNESVTIKSRITYGAIICMNKYVAVHYPDIKEEALRGLLSRADLAKNIGSVQISLLNGCLLALIGERKIRCCDPFRPMYKGKNLSPCKPANKDLIASTNSELEESAKVHSQSICKEFKSNAEPALDETPPAKSDSTLIDSSNQASHPMEISTCNSAVLSVTTEELGLVTLVSDSNEIVLQTNANQFLISKVPADSKCSIPTNFEIITKSVSKVNPCLYNLVCNERKSLSHNIQLLYDQLLCNTKLSDEEKTTLKRKTLTNAEVLDIHSLCILKAKEPNLDSYYKLFLEICLHRGFVLFIPDGHTLVKHVETLRRDYNRKKFSKNKSFGCLPWDVENLYSAPLKADKASESYPSIGEILKVFCLWRTKTLYPLEESQNIALRKAILKLFKEEIIIKDCCGLCVRLFVKYCNLAFDEEEPSKVRLFLSLYYLPKINQETLSNITSFDPKITFLPPSKKDLSNVISFYEQQTQDSVRDLKRLFPETVIEYKLNQTKKLKTEILSQVKAPKIVKLLDTYAALKVQMSYWESLKNLDEEVSNESNSLVKAAPSCTDEVKLMIAKLKAANVPSKNIPIVIEKIFKNILKKKMPLLPDFSSL